MTIIDLIKQIKPIPELFIIKHSIFSLEVFIDGWCYPQNFMNGYKKNTK